MTGSETDSPTLLQQRGIQERMHCNGQTASRIEKAFVTVEQLVEAVRSDKPLTEYDGIGPKTAETVEDWWANRFEREEQMDDSTFERTGARTASIYLHNSWEDAIQEGDTDGE